MLCILSCDILSESVVYYLLVITVSVSEGSSVNAETMPLISKSMATKFDYATDFRR